MGDQRGIVTEGAAQVAAACKYGGSQFSREIHHRQFLQTADPHPPFLLMMPDAGSEIVCLYHKSILPPGQAHYDRVERLGRPLAGHHRL